MKRQFTILIVLMFFTALSILGQADSDRSIDMRKAELERKLEGLKKQEVFELERLVRLKELELARMKTANDTLETRLNGNEEITVSDVIPSTSESEAISPVTRPTTKQNSGSEETESSNRKAAKQYSDFVRVSSDLPTGTGDLLKPKSVSNDSRPNAQDDPLDCEPRGTFFEKQICRWAVSIADKSEPFFGLDRKDLAIPVLLGHMLQNEEFKGKFKDEVSRDFLIEAEDSRTDKQVGAGSGSSGTTSLAVRGGVPAFFNWATERGAATSSTNGTTTTFRFNPVGFLETVTGKPPVTVNDPYANQPFLDFLKKTSIGASFDISRGEMPNMFTGSGQQLSALSFRYELINQRNDYKKKLGDFLSDNKIQDYAEEQINAFNILFKNNEDEDEVFKNSEAQDWIDSTDSKVNALANKAGYDSMSLKEKGEEIEKIITDSLKNLNVSELAKDKDFIGGLTASVSAAQNYVSQARKFVNAAKKGTVFTFEYVNNREVAMTDTSDIRFIFERNTFFGADFTFNGAMSFYHSKPTGMTISRLKSFDFATQLDVPLNGLEFLDRGYLTFAGKYKRLNDDAFMFNGTTLPDTKGDIWVGQIKLTIPIAKGIRLPISATFANRTDLIKEQETRGNFGLTFDVDTLFTMLTRPRQ